MRKDKSDEIWRNEFDYDNEGRSEVKRDLVKKSGLRLWLIFGSFLIIKKKKKKFLNFRGEQIVLALKDGGTNCSGTKKNFFFCLVSK